MTYNEFFLTDGCETRFFARQWAPEIPKGILVLLHGLSDHGGRFAWVAEKFAEAGYVFLAPDLRGNGKSDGRRGHFDSLDQIMNDIQFFIAQAKLLHPGIPVILYSQSMGGNLAINFTLRFPNEITCSIASSPWLRLSAPPALPVRKVASLLLKFFPSLLIPNGIKSADLCHDTHISHSYDTDPLIHWKISLITFFIINGSGQWAIDHAASLKIPLLLLHSQADPITSFAASEEFKRNSNAMLTFIPYLTQFHELHNEPERNEVLDLEINWINSIVKG